MVIINFWLLLSPAAEIALKGIAKIGPPTITDGPVPGPIRVDSIEFPLANVMSAATIKLVRNYPERNSSLFPTGVWNCYASGEGFYEFVGVREDLQELNTRYPDHFNVAGCWDYETGEPIGGVGSPWFTTPPTLASIMPDILQPGELTGPPPHPLGAPLVGVLQDIVLGAGQAKRKFV